MYFFVTSKMYLKILGEAFSVQNKQPDFRKICFFYFFIFVAIFLFVFSDLGTLTKNEGVFLLSLRMFGWTTDLNARAMASCSLLRWLSIFTPYFFVSISAPTVVINNIFFLSEGKNFRVKKFR